MRSEAISHIAKTDALALWPALKGARRKEVVMRPGMTVLLAVVLAVMLGSVCCLAADTPISKGSKVIGGGLSFSSMGGDLYEVDDERTSYLMANPFLSVFVADGFSVGGSMLLDRYSEEGYTSMTIGIGPRLAYFFGAAGTRPDVKGSIYPTIGMAVFYSRGSVDMESLDITVSGLTFVFGGGVVYMVTRDIGISVELTYEIDDMTADYEWDGYSEEESENGDRINFVVGLADFMYR